MRTQGADFVYRDLFYTGSGSNYHHYSDSKADEMIDIVATEKDQDKRLETAKELQTHLVDACPQVPLYIANLVVAYNKNLQGQYFYGGGQTMTGVMHTSQSKEKQRHKWLKDLRVLKSPASFHMSH